MKYAREWCEQIVPRIARAPEKALIYLNGSLIGI